jgi:hypothetical protein
MPSLFVSRKNEEGKLTLNGKPVDESSTDALRTLVPRLLPPKPAPKAEGPTVDPALCRQAIAEGQLRARALVVKAVGEDTATTLALAYGSRDSVTRARARRPSRRGGARV